MTPREAAAPAQLALFRADTGGEPVVVALAGALGKRSTAALLGRVLGAAPAAAGPPRVAVVLNVGCAGHGKQRAAEAMGALLDGLPPGGLAVLNADDPYARALVPRSAAPVLTFGRTDGDVRAVGVTLDGAGRAAFTLTDQHGAGAPVRLARPGACQVFNAAAAAAVALGLGRELGQVAGALGDWGPEPAE
ncbi:Mur ligase family protein [Kitasatospora sp. NPDC058965]|uniref:Mur ligase family protein n=1 Tax=Kitasatospora sp. NPDC058965 TaxID=3346682 RepID=UPI0036C613BA